MDARVMIVLLQLLLPLARARRFQRRSLLHDFVKDFAA